MCGGAKDVAPRHGRHVYQPGGASERFGSFKQPRNAVWCFGSPAVLVVVLVLRRLMCPGRRGDTVIETGCLTSSFWMADGRILLLHRARPGPQRMAPARESLNGGSKFDGSGVMQPCHDNNPSFPHAHHQSTKTAPSSPLRFDGPIKWRGGL